MVFASPTSHASTTYWPQKYGQADALVLAELLQKSASLLIVVVPNMPAAEQLESALRLFLPTDSDGPSAILTLPDWETLPYDSFSPHQDIISQRLHCLYQLPTLRQGILIAPLTTALVRLPPKSFIAGSSLVLETGQQLDVTEYRRFLESAGYRCVDTVYEHGEFAVRGSILDIFPMGRNTPYRIDLFDNEVDSIRYFDPDTQRSGQKTETVDLLPAHEFPLTDAAIKTFKLNFHEQFPEAPRNTPLLKDLSKGIPSPGIEYFLGLFFNETATLFDYLDDTTTFILYDHLHQTCEHFWQELNNRYEDLRHNLERPILPPEQIYLRTEEVFAHFKRFKRAQFTLPEQASAKSISPAQSTFEPTFSEQTVGGDHTKAQRFRPVPDITVQSKADDPFASLKTLQMQIGKVCICAESSGREQVLIETLKDHGIAVIQLTSWQQIIATDFQWGITQAELTAGFIDNTHRLALLAEADLYQDRVPQRRRRKRSSSADHANNIVQNLTELKVGAPVVHIDHGVGRYQGLQTLEAGGQTQEFLLLEYANGDKLYVPVASLHLISRYSGIDDALAPISKLGTDRWSTARRKAAEKIKDTAAELLEVYARRGSNPGFACQPPDESYRQFASDFPFEETPDQLTAINSVVADMTKPNPMDRLICGDVGFGKTEVAMRAAFLAAHSGRQVAILAPTTLLAQQHFQSLQDRFSQTPINIELISRFRTAAEVEKVKAKLANGNVDIIIGTHKLLQKDIKFQDLGLLIIDEEHRFGVSQKERVKALRANIDILAMTATPIPRTLNLSLQGVRDLSIISTPPERRLSVKTFVQEHSPAIIKEALMREILRGGQAFFLHNEVSSIDKTAKELETLVPDARIVVAHGQMRERELEKVMSDFYHKRFNVLVCTTIIETGIDIPSANTIIINRANNFGLAQLHQLRGRVGRSHHQAYAYLLTPPPRSITADANKRLQAIKDAQDLGAGFTLATHDLEIRGAGELLGEEQSGHIQTIGFSLYSQLLDAAIKAMQKGEELNPDQPFSGGCDINFRLPALIPDAYLPDVHNRLILYKRIANAEDEAALRDLQVEMIDRFGLLPDPTKTLFRQHKIKLVADRIGIIKLDLGAKGGTVEFAAKTTVEPMTLVNLIQKNPSTYKLEGGSKFKVMKELGLPEQRIEFAEELLTTLENPS